MSTDEMKEKIMELNPEAHCTYHHRSPIYDDSYGYQWHEWGKPIGKISPDLYTASKSALDALINEALNDYDELEYNGEW